MDNQLNSSISCVRRRSSTAIAFSEQSSILSDCLDSFPTPPMNTDSISHGAQEASLPADEQLSPLCDRPFFGQPDSGTHSWDRDMPNADAYSMPSQMAGTRSSILVPPEELSWSPQQHQADPNELSAYHPVESDLKVVSHLQLPVTPHGHDLYTPNTDITVVSSDPVYHRPVGCVGTLKFTQKWPKPSTLKNLDGQHGRKKIHTPLIGTPVETVEEGKGRGVVSAGRWAPAKIWLVVSTTMVLAYGIAFLLLASMTWFNAWMNAGVMAVADFDVLAVVTLSATFLVITALLGISGTFLDSRPFLAVYTVLLWPNLIFILATGYISYKRVTFNLDRKLDMAWTHSYTVEGKQVIQDALRCCGFYNPLHDPSPSKRCYSRSPLPGCRDALFNFEQEELRMMYRVAFLVGAVHMVNIIIALLASNHITRRFGKGLTPRVYRLNREDVRKEAEKVYGGAGSGPDGFSQGREYKN